MSQKIIWFLGIGLVAAVLAGIVLWYPQETTEVVPEEQFVEEASVPALNQFVQQEPDSAPTELVLPADEATALGPVPENSAAPATSGENVTVSLEDTGFSPAELTVAAGTTVTFVNNGQALHWPASDNHPTHEALPEFDAQRALTTGETYSHTFTKVGTWTLHDHLMPQLTGTITVQ